MTEAVVIRVGAQYVKARNVARFVERKDASIFADRRIIVGYDAVSKAVYETLSGRSAAIALIAAQPKLAGGVIENV